MVCWWQQLIWWVAPVLQAVHTLNDQISLTLGMFTLSHHYPAGLSVLIHHPAASSRETHLEVVYHQIRFLPLQAV